VEDETESVQNVENDEKRKRHFVKNAFGPTVLLTGAIDLKETNNDVAKIRKKMGIVGHL
jgi:hypothetical protein